MVNVSESMEILLINPRYFQMYLIQGFNISAFLQFSIWKGSIYIFYVQPELTAIGKLFKLNFVNMKYKNIVMQIAEPLKIFLEILYKPCSGNFSVEYP